MHSVPLLHDFRHQEASPGIASRADVPRLFAATEPLLTDDERQETLPKRMTLLAARLAGRAIRGFFAPIEDPSAVATRPDGQGPAAAQGERRELTGVDD